MKQIGLFRYLLRNDRRYCLGFATFIYSTDGVFSFFFFSSLLLDL